MKIQCFDVNDLYNRFHFNCYLKMTCNILLKDMEKTSEIADSSAENRISITNNNYVSNTDITGQTITYMYTDSKNIISSSSHKKNYLTV